MFEHIQEHGVLPLLLRGHVSASNYPAPKERVELRIIIHPSPLTSRFFANFPIEAGWVDRVEFVEVANGAGAIATITSDPVNGMARFHMPHCSPWTTEELRLWPSDQPLNEFGFLYVAMFIAGNYTRYFPDKWLRDVETSDPLAVAIEELTELAEWRAPWLCLCELARIAYVPQE